MSIDSSFYKKGSKIMKSASVSTNTVYRFIINFFEENGYAPSFREIAEGTGIKSTSTVQGHMNILHNDGKIQYEPTKSRAIKLVGWKFVKI